MCVRLAVVHVILLLCSVFVSCFTCITLWFNLYTRLVLLATLKRTTWIWNPCTTTGRRSKIFMRKVLAPEKAATPSITDGLNAMYEAWAAS
ncbi:hypothetical protein KPH14_007736 [Odynerus spinipes]|uniref:Uncharacterized protein n=1 Tax=Odynerus spinipes TaxID=1348599 RepID=A0AAD9RK40_9HYME|nr:hypothetical protein KPH14_007736 [Odynerus spinipes]